MNRKQKKLLLYLTGAVVLLLAVLLIVVGIKSKKAEQEEAAEESASITEVRPYSSLTYSNGSATLSFTLGEDGSWIWADDPDFPLDDMNVGVIVDLISSIKPQQTITDGDTLEAYGLDQPSMTLTATSAEDGSTLRIALGKTTTDGKSYYMMMNDDESTVYIIADALSQRLIVPIYDMMKLPELPVLTADNLVSVTVEGTVSTVLTAQRPESPDEEASSADGTEEGTTDERAVTWRSGGSNVTDDPTVTAFLDELSQVELLGCVDFKPTEEAVSICGFDAPTAVLTAKYLGDGTAEQTFTLTIGGALPGDDADGDYYARIDGDTTIYRINNNRIEKLLALAESGLE
jgi:hypothetical protein